MTQSVDNVQVLWKIMQLLESDRIEDALLDAFEELLKYVAASSGAIWLKNNDSKRIYSIVGVGDINITGYSIEFDQGLVGQAAQSKDYLLIKDVSGDVRFPAGKDEITGIEVNNVMCMPVILRKQTIGCVEIFNKSENDDYSEEELSVIRSFAGLAGLLIDEKGYSYAPDVDKKIIMSLKDIKKDFMSGTEVTHILKGVDLDIYENELLVILGESGCGKSTLLNIIGGMDSATSGNITIDGKDFSHPTQKQLTDYRRDDIGFIFQSYNLMPNLTAVENVKFIAEISKNPLDAMEAIDMVGLTERANNYPSMMSGGQQQRVCIARAIAKNPRLILADEPTAALDFRTGQDVLVLIEELIAKKMTTIIMVTHNIEIAKMANRVIRMKDGRVSSVRINAWPMKAAELEW